MSIFVFVDDEGDQKKCSLKIQKDIFYLHINLHIVYIIFLLSLTVPM